MAAYYSGLATIIMEEVQSTAYKAWFASSCLFVCLVTGLLVFLYAFAIMFCRLHEHALALLGLLTLSNCSPLTARDVTKANAEAAYSSLQQWYNQSTGLWIPSTGWWNSANCKPQA